MNVTVFLNGNETAFATSYRMPKIGGKYKGCEVVDIRQVYPGDEQYFHGQQSALSQVAKRFLGPADGSDHHDAGLCRRAQLFADDDADLGPALRSHSPDSLLLFA